MSRLSRDRAGSTSKQQPSSPWCNSSPVFRLNEVHSSDRPRTIIAGGRHDSLRGVRTSRVLRKAACSSAGLSRARGRVNAKHNDAAAGQFGSVFIPPIERSRHGEDHSSGQRYPGDRQQNDGRVNGAGVDI